MDAVVRRSHTRFGVVSRNLEPTDSCIDEIKIARRRMRHLAPWNVKPLPVMHSVFGTPGEPLSAAARERSRRVALQVLAVQMWHVRSKSALL